MRVSGSIDFIEIDDLKPIVFKIFGEANVKFKIRIFGEQFTILNEEAELHIETFDPLNKFPMKKPRYMIDWEIKMSLEKSLIELNRFTTILRSKNVSYAIAFYPIDGDESVEMELRSIGYYDEYEQMKIK